MKVILWVVGVLALISTALATAPGIDRKSNDEMAADNTAALNGDFHLDNINSLLSNYEEKFTKWLKKYNIVSIAKSNIKEYLKRLTIFAKNDWFIMRHNQKKNKDFTLDHNQFSALTYEEFKASLSGFKVNQHQILRDVQTNWEEDARNAPEEVDWVQKGAVTNVKNQGMCGSCWAFSTTGAVEGAVFLSSGKLVALSEQELVDCDDNGDMGCQGGLMDHAFDWIKRDGGICAESEYPYKANQTECLECKKVATVSKHTDVRPNNEKALLAAVSRQPVSVAIEADQPEFQFYKSGVFTHPCGTKLDHGVLAVGYGEENGVKYWKVKNSWGEGWGDKGYIKLAREVTSPAGQCGIAMAASYPTATLLASDNTEKKPFAQQKSIDSSVSIEQCGDIKNSIINFKDLSVSPKSPKRGKPINFSGSGIATQEFNSAAFTLSVKLAGQQVFAHGGNMCGFTHIPLPLGLGHIDIHGFKCPMSPGNFDDIALSVNLPVIAPAGDYEINITSDKDNTSLFCIRVNMDLNADERARQAKVYEYLNV